MMPSKPLYNSIKGGIHKQKVSKREKEKEKEIKKK